MTTTLIGLSGCPECGSADLVPVVADLETNYLCEDCACCWHLVGEDALLVDPNSCPGCSMGSTACLKRLALAGEWPAPPKPTERRLPKPRWLWT
jgi:hypothetical protein